MPGWVRRLNLLDKLANIEAAVSEGSKIEVVDSLASASCETGKVVVVTGYPPAIYYCTSQGPRLLYGFPVKRGVKTGVTVSGTDEVEVAKLETEGIYCVDGVKITATNPKGSGCNLSIEVRVVDIEGNTYNVASRTVLEGQDFDDVLRHLDETIDTDINNTTITKIVVVAQCDKEPSAEVSVSAEISATTAG